MPHGPSARCTLHRRWHMGGASAATQATAAPGRACPCPPQWRCCAPFGWLQHLLARLCEPQLAERQRTWRRRRQCWVAAAAAAQPPLDRCRAGQPRLGRMSQAGEAAAAVPQRSCASFGCSGLPGGGPRAVAVIAPWRPGVCRCCKVPWAGEGRRTNPNCAAVAKGAALRAQRASVHQCRAIGDATKPAAQARTSWGRPPQRRHNRTLVRKPRFVLAPSHQCVARKLTRLLLQWRGALEKKGLAR